PPRRRTACQVTRMLAATPSATATGPCHGRPGTAGTATTATASQPAYPASGVTVPLTRAPIPSGRAAGTPRRQASAIPTRPAAVAAATPATTAYHGRVSISASAAT